MTPTDPNVNPTSIAAQVAQLEADMADDLPAHAISAFSAEQRRMATQGVPPEAARAGTDMPDATLLDVHGSPTSLAELRAGRPAVVVFYRGQWCPYCNLALRTYQRDLLPTLSDRAVPLIAVSPQTPDGSLNTAELNALTFAVVTDPGNQLARRLGILTSPSQDVRDTTLELGLDLARANTDGRYEVPMPTVVVVDADGVISWIDVHPDYTTRSEVPAILAAVGRLG